MKTENISPKSPTDFAVLMLLENKKRGNNFIALSKARNKIERMMQKALNDDSYEIEKWQVSNALGHAEKVLIEVHSENLAIERGNRNKKLAWRIAEPEDKPLIERNLEIRMKLSKGNGNNMMSLEVVAKGNDILEEGANYKGILEDFFTKANLLN